MKISNPVGRLGEGKSSKYLQKKGYKIIDRNFRHGYGEIDIVAVKDNVLIFIEVKTRKSVNFGSPIESITKRKLSVLKRTIEYYKKLHPNTPEEMRFDVISVVLGGGQEKIEHLENATFF